MVTECAEGTARYQARANVMVANELQQIWTVKCYPPTHEVATLILAGLLVGEDDGGFPDPVVIPVLCCGQQRR